MRLPWCSIYFLVLAKNDLCAAKLLYNHGLHAHSLFWLSQAVEKALKSFLAVGKDETYCKELKRLRHEPIYHEVRKEMSEQTRRLRHVAKLLTSKGAKEGLVNKLIDLANRFEQTVKDIEELHFTDVREILNDEDMLQRLISTAKEFLEELKHIHNNKPDLEEILRDPYFVQSIEMLKEYARMITPLDAEQIDKVIKLFIDTIPMLVSHIEAFYGFAALLPIQLLFETCRISTLTRYPEKPDLGPKELSNTAMAKYIPALLEIVDTAIEAIDRETKQLQEVVKKTKETYT
ncbi:hypothetical protein DRJ17_07190 [Candidatus Woesearchaeota archaeon]|nr:MAG: hypothetical protein DRJ17_07190 [Candidatus Woesearchaeota archaeon]